MRADRLLSILMLLQTHGKMTAEDLSRELEVSVRTIYRDAGALEMAGVPITTERGPGGGMALLDSYRTTLTGLTEQEVEALFMLEVPGILTDLGVSSSLQTALRKVAAAMPTRQQRGRQRVRQRVHLDSAPWHQRPQAQASVQLVHRALREDRCLVIRYQLAWEAERTRVVRPLGLVAKENAWHLVCTWGAGPRVIEFSDLVAIRRSDAQIERPRDFELSRFWDEWRERAARNRSTYAAILAVAPALHRAFSRGSIGPQIETLSGPDDEGWYQVQLIADSFEVARTRVLGWGHAARVIEPVALRESVLDFARQVLQAYPEKTQRESWPPRETR